MPLNVTQPMSTIALVMLIALACNIDCIGHYVSLAEHSKRQDGREGGRRRPRWRRRRPRQQQAALAAATTTMTTLMAHFVHNRSSGNYSLRGHQAVNQIEIVDAHGCSVLDSELKTPSPENLTTAIEKHAAASLKNKISFQDSGV